MDLVSTNQKLLLLLACLLSMVSVGCKKNATNYNNTSITLNSEEVSNGIQLSWNLVNSSDFVRYEVYRSSSPIPDPTAQQPINPSLQIGTISNSDNHFFVDSVSSGNNYYRVQVVLKYRNLMSNMVQMRNGLSFLGTFSDVAISKDLQLLYVFNGGGQLSVIDYLKDSMLISNRSVNFMQYHFGKNENNQTVLYAIESSVMSVVKEYDARTLQLIRNHSIPVFSQQFIVNKGMMYLCQNNDSLVTYNLSNDTRVAGVSCNNCTIPRLSEDGNALLVTSFSGGVLYYYDIDMNTLPVLKYAKNDDYSFSNFCVLSPHGNYMISLNGQLVDQQQNFINFLQIVGFANFIEFEFSADEKFVFANQQNVIGMYSVNNQSLVASITISNSFFSSPSMFVDGKKLIIIVNSFDQFTGQNIVLIKKKSLDI